MKPAYTYNSRWYWLLRGLPLFLLLIVALQTAWTWVRALMTLLNQWRELPVDPLWQLPVTPLMALGGSFLALFITAQCALFVSNLLVPITLSEQGLYFHLLRRPRFIPWEEIDSFFASRLGISERVLLFVRTVSGAPWYSRFYGLAVGAGFWPGFLVTSDMDNFGPALGHTLRSVEDERGIEQVRFDEQQAGPFAAIILTPHQRLAFLWPIDEQGQPAATIIQPGVLQQAARIAAIVALALPMVLLIKQLLALSMTFSPVILLLLALLEWPIASYWLVAIGDLLAHPYPWPDMLALYPELQLPRWLIALACLALVLTQAPLWLFSLPILAGLLWSGWLLTLLTQRIYNIQDRRSMLGAALPLIYQALLYGMLLYFLGI